MHAAESLKEPLPRWVERTGRAVVGLKEANSSCSKEQEESLGRDRGRVCSGKEGNANA